jgi:type II secretion system protein N
MDRQKSILFFSGVVLWGVFVAALMVYLFFPYQKALRIALQNVVGSRTSVAMEGVSMKTMGIAASRLLLQPAASTDQAGPFELTHVDISWNPLSLLGGKLAIKSKASIYDGTMQCSIDGIPFTGAANPNILLRLERINLGKCPEGALPWFKDISGSLDGVIKKETPLARPDTQTGSFRFDLKGGEVKELQARNMPRLVIPYKRIVIEGKIDGPRIDVTSIVLTSDAVSIKGSGTIETTDTGQNVDIRASYEALSKAFPLKGKGTITISGNQASPNVVVISGGPQAAGVALRMR